MTKSRWTRTNVIALIATLAMAIGVVGIMLAASRLPASMAQVAGTGLVVEAACATVGGLIGFLFGIPRSVVSDDVSQEADREPSRRRRYNVNTNLEQISDWLTKILVGVGLVQLESIARSVSRLIDRVALDLGGGPGGTSLAGGLIIYSAIIGFMSGYLLTRTVLTKTLSEYDSLLDRVDVVEERATRAEHLSTQVARDVEALAGADAVLGGEEDAPHEDDLVKVFRDASPSVVRQIFSRARSARAVNWRASKKDAMARAIPIFRALTQLDDTHRYHRNYGELGYALKDQEVPDWTGAESALSEAIRIRDEQKVPGFQLYEYNRAICRVALDPTQDSGGPSEPALQSAIKRDLVRAAENSTVRRGNLIANDARLIGWLSRNRLNVSDVS